MSATMARRSVGAAESGICPDLGDYLGRHLD
jgi:hypothetical protein